MSLRKCVAKAQSVSKVPKVTTKFISRLELYYSIFTFNRFGRKTWFKDENNNSITVKPFAETSERPKVPWRIFQIDKRPFEGLKSVPHKFCSTAGLPKILRTLP